MMVFLLDFPLKHKRIQAIKFVRRVTGCPLREAKEWVVSDTKEALYLGNPPKEHVMDEAKGLEAKLLEVEAPTMWDHLED